MHPRFGTRNFILPLLNGVYLEVVEPLDHPATDKAPFGRAVKARSEAGGGWLAWVVSVDDISTVEVRIGRSAVLGQRRRPDGMVLSWKQIGVLDMLDDPALPFFTQWEIDPAFHPSANPEVPIGIEAAEICGNAATIAAWLDEPLERPTSASTGSRTRTPVWLRCTSRRCAAPSASTDRPSPPRSRPRLVCQASPSIGMHAC